MATAEQIATARTAALAALITIDAGTVRMIMEAIPQPKPSFRALRSALSEMVSARDAITWVSSPVSRRGFRPNVYRLTTVGRTEAMGFS